MKEPCPYCGKPVRLGDTREIYGRFYGMAWICSGYPECDAYVGCHNMTNKPLGTLANAELREARNKAHSAFNKIWRNGLITRKSAYKVLQRVMLMTESEAHIAKMSIEQCRKVASINWEEKI